MEKIKKFFKIEERGTTVRTEIIGGIVTFLAMAYILAVNPGILGETGMPSGGVFIATAISSAVATLIMGLYANYPIALAPGMGINALFAYTVVLTLGYTWQEALAATFISGIIFLIISFTPLRRSIINAVPASLKKAIGAGIGFFIAFIGLKNAGIIVSSPATFVTLGNFSNPSVLLATFGILLVLILFAVRHKISKFSFILSILTTAVIGIVLGLFGVSGMPSFTGGYTDLNTFSETLFAFGAGMKTVFGHADLWFVVFSFLYLDIFDTAGTLISVAEPAGLLNDKGEMENIDRALMSDAIGTVVGSIVGTSTVTSYVESTSGIESGARTGLSSVVVGLLFLVSIVAYPVFSVFINSPAVTSMALVMVGIMMVGQLQHIEWSDKPTLAASFVTIIMMILTYSIGNGIAFGFIVYVVMMLIQKRQKEVTWVMYALSIAFIAYFAINALV